MLRFLRLQVFLPAALVSNGLIHNADKKGVPVATAELALIPEDGELAAETLTATTPEEVVESDVSEDATDEEEEEDTPDDEEEEEDIPDDEEGEEDIPFLTAADAPLTTPVLHGRLACLFHSKLVMTDV